jgi:hypothetical protein
MSESDGETVAEHTARVPHGPVAAPSERVALGRASRRFLGALIVLGGIGVAAAAIGAAMRGSSIPRLVANAALPGTLLLAAMAARRCAPRRQTQVALCIVASIGTFYVFAAALEVVQMDPFERKIRELRAMGREFDERTVRGFVLDARKDGADVLPLLVPRALIHHSDHGYRSEISLGGREVIPLSSISHATVTLGNETGRHATIKLDRHGFNNPDKVWDERSIDVAAIGDSFTMGKCVAESENAVARIREVRPATVNLGVAGNSPLFNFATLVEYAAPLKPKLVLWMHYANDLAPYELNQDEQTPLLMRYLESGFSQHLEEIRPAIDAALRERAEAELAKPGPDTCWDAFRSLRGPVSSRVSRVLLLSSLRSMIASAMGDRPPEWSPDIAFYSRVLHEARKRVDAWGGRLLWVYVPDVEEFDSNPSSNLIPVFRARATLLDAVRSLGIETIDLLPALASGGDPRSLYAWERTSPAGLPHLTASGYAVAASEILKHLPPQSLEATSVPPREK